MVPMKQYKQGLLEESPNQKETVWSNQSPIDLPGAPNEQQS